MAPAYCEGDPEREQLLEDAALIQTSEASLLTSCCTVAEAAAVDMAHPEDDSLLLGQTEDQLADIQHYLQIPECWELWWWACEVHSAAGHHTMDALTWQRVELAEEATCAVEEARFAAIAEELLRAMTSKKYSGW